MKNNEDNIINESLAGFLRVVDVLYKTSMVISTLYTLYKSMHNNNIYIEQQDIESPQESSHMQKLFKKFSKTMSLIQNYITNNYANMTLLLDKIHRIVTSYKNKKNLNIQDLQEILDLFLIILNNVEQNLESNTDKRNVSELKRYLLSSKETNIYETNVHENIDLVKYIKEKL